MLNEYAYISNSKYSWIFTSSRYFRILQLARAVEKFLSLELVLKTHYLEHLRCIPTLKKNEINDRLEVLRSCTVLGLLIFFVLIQVY